MRLDVRPESQERWRVGVQDYLDGLTTCAESVCESIVWDPAEETAEKRMGEAEEEAANEPKSAATKDDKRRGVVHLAPNLRIGHPPIQLTNRRGSSGLASYGEPSQRLCLDNRERPSTEPKLAPSRSTCSSSPELSTAGMNTTPLPTPFKCSNCGNVACEPNFDENRLGHNDELRQVVCNACNWEMQVGRHRESAEQFIKPSKDSDHRTTSGLAVLRLWCSNHGEVFACGAESFVDDTFKDEGSLAAQATNDDALAALPLISLFRPARERGCSAPPWPARSVGNPTAAGVLETGTRMTPRTANS